jgi:hypothetical protein
MSLVALAKAGPAVVSDAFQARGSLRRARGIGLRRRMGLWGRALARLTLKRSSGLARTLAKRQGELR